MKKIELKKVNHSVKIGQECGEFEPNITEDSLFIEDGEIVGFFIKSISEHSEKLMKLINIANSEFRSKKVPKSEMKRSTGVNTKHYGNDHNVEQLSAIIGSIPPKPLMRRPYPSISSVHTSKTAQNFIKAMFLAAKESEEIIKKIAPKIYKKQIKLIEENVPKKWRFGKMFTSSISNYNISAPFHRDTGNIEGCVNVIITKKKFATGGDLHVPDYNATMDSADNSMLVYPAWKNVHGVTPIKPFREDGYRNSLIFYPLKAFKNH